MLIMFSNKDNFRFRIWSRQSEHFLLDSWSLSSAGFHCKFWPIGSLYRESFFFFFNFISFDCGSEREALLI